VVISVIHLPPLPGSPGFKGALEDLIGFGVKNAKILEETGFDAIIIENFGDKPYLVRVRNPLTIASMTVIVREVIRSVNIPIGINLLRNSGLEALAIAYATGALFIRVNAYCQPLWSVEGFLEPLAPKIERLRARIVKDIKILADANVKHSWPIGSPTIRYIVRECCERAKPDAIIVTGSRTGEAPLIEEVLEVREESRVPIIIGSDMTAENLSSYWGLADGFIVGSYIMSNGIAGNPIDSQRAERFMKKVRELRLISY